MKRFLLVALVAGLVLPGFAFAGGAKLGGYLAPRFEIHDMGSYTDDEGTEKDYARHMGFGMAFNRIYGKGTIDIENSPVKSVAWRAELDFSNPADPQKLIWGFVEPRFNDMFSIRMGHVKKAFSREILHPTAKLLTVDRHIAGFLAGLGYGGFNYGMEAHIKGEKFHVQAGAYAGAGSPARIANQDPAIDFGVRATFEPIEGLSLGGDFMMTSIPEGGRNSGPYNDDYEKASTSAFGADFDYKKSFGDMSLWLQGEFDAGKNPGTAHWAEGDTTMAWGDAEFYSFQVMSLKALLMVTPNFGVHFGYSSMDPNTDSDTGENNSTVLMTPGVVYKWSKNLRTQFEAQMVTYQNGVDAEGKELDDTKYTHLVLQTVFVW